MSSRTHNRIIKSFFSDTNTVDREVVPGVHGPCLVVGIWRHDALDEAVPATTVHVRNGKEGDTLAQPLWWDAAIYNPANPGGRFSKAFFLAKDEELYLNFAGVLNLDVAGYIEYDEYPRRTDKPGK